MRSATFIALLRGINVTGRNKIPMAELCALCADLGWSDVQSYIQSGNVVFRAAAAAAKLEDKLEQAIAKHFNLTIPVIVRPASAWPGYVRSNPFLKECRTEPGFVMLALSKAPPKPQAVDQLRERAAGERLAMINDVIWIHYPKGAGQSKLSPALFDRLVGSPVTARNWRTVLKIQSMAGPSADPR